MPRHCAVPTTVFAGFGLVVFACGPGGGASSGSQASASTESGEAESGTLGDGDCDEFLPADGEFGPPVEVSLRNDRAETIWVVNARATDCFIEIPFSVADASDEGVVWKTTETEFTCPTVLDPEGFCGFECGVVQPIFRIEPGATLAVTWRASGFSLVDLPAQCPGCQDACWLERPIEDGDYTLRAVAGTECGGDCCTPDASGTCSGPAEPGGGPVGETLEATASLSYPQQTAVELVFD